MKVVKEQKIKYCNAYKRIPERDKSVDLIYICHMIEHLDQEETSNILQECKRVLKPGGIVRIVVPDFDRLVDSYNQDHDVDRFIHDSCLVGKKPKKLIKKIQYLLQGHGWHHQMFNKKSLERKLNLYGFLKIKFFEAGESAIPFENGINYSDFSEQSIYCECQH
jgi:Uncharacterized protein conserved in bacteria